MAAKGPDFNHAMVYVRDVERALAFYHGLLGFKVISRVEHYARLKSPKGRTTVALHEFDAGMKRPARGTVTHRLYFEVADLDAFCSRLKRRGVKFQSMPRDYPWGWRHAYLKDPDGNELSLYSAGARRLRGP